MDKKKLIEKMILESQGRIRQLEEAYAREEILEGYAKILIFRSPTQDANLALGKLQSEMRTTKKAIEKENDLIKFLNEEKKELNDKK